MATPDDSAPRRAGGGSRQAGRRRGWLRAVSWMAVGGGVTVAALAGAAALALAALEDRPGLAADWLAEQLGREVRLREMMVAWDGRSPVLRLRGLQVGGADGLALDDTEVRVAAFASLRAGALRPAAVTVRGAAITLDRDPSGVVTVAGLGRARRAASGTALGDAVGRALGSTLALLPDSAELSLRGASITLSGIAPDPFTLEPVTLRLDRANGTVRVTGTLGASDTRDSPARFSLRWPHDAQDPLARADVTLSTRALALESLPAALRRAPLGGRLSLDLDGSLVDGRLASMRGTAALDAPRLTDGGRALDAVESMDGLLEFRRGDDGWQMDVIRLQARIAGRSLPPTSARLAFRTGEPEAPWHVAMSGAPLADLLPVVHALPMPDTALRRLADAVQPEGRVEDLALELVDDLSRVRGGSLRLLDVRLRSAPGGLDAGPLDAAVTLRERGGRIAVSPARLRLGPAATEEPLAIGFAGELAWRRLAGGLELSSSDLGFADGASRLQVSGRVALPGAAGAPMRVALAARSDALKVDTLRRYLTLPGLPEALRGWLREALDGGSLFAFEARAEGEAASPADALRLVEARARVGGTTIRYREEWPALDALSGEITLDRGALGFRIESGSVHGATIVAASGGIADVTAPEPAVTLDAEIAGSTLQATGFITDSPLGERFPGLLPQLDARGEARVVLRMQVPIGLGGPERTRLDGRIHLVDNTLEVPGLRSPLTGVEGTLAFDRDGLGSGTLQARYLERRIEADVDGTLDGHELTRLTIRGRTDPDGLLRHLYDVGAIASRDRDALPLLSRLDGEAGWRVVMDIPHRSVRAGEGIALSVSSELEGMALRLPAPLGKPRAGAQRLVVRTRLADAGERLFDVAFGDRIRATIRAVARAGEGGNSSDNADRRDFRFDRGELRFGGGGAALPDTPGLRVVGDVETLSVDDWVSFIALAAAGLDARDASVLATVDGIAIAASRLDVLGAAFDAVALRAHRGTSGAWRIAVRGDGVDGVIDVPWPVGSAPIDARFEHLHVHREARAETGADGPPPALEPKDLPPARLVARRLLYNDVDLGTAKLTLSRAADGLLVEELVAIGASFEVRGSGRWSRDGERTLSQVDLAIHSPDFGALTAAFGYGDSGVEGGVADIGLRARWEGSPFDLALGRITGNLSFRASDGRLREVEPGTTGRMFGLLNVTVLPRRLLRLDFSDLFEEGVAYQSLRGNFRLADGNAWTEDTVMQTENARVELVGRVGLVAEDYEQVMTVTPKLSTSLPLAPLWLAEKFLNRKLIDGAFKYRYIITGTWSDPHIERERVEAIPTDAG